MMWSFMQEYGLCLILNLTLKFSQANGTNGAHQQNGDDLGREKLLDAELLVRELREALEDMGAAAGRKPLPDGLERARAAAVRNLAPSLS